MLKKYCTLTLIFTAAVSAQTKVINKPYQHTVGRSDAHQSEVFEIINDKDHIATLEVTPASKSDKFIKEKSRIIDSRRHNSEPWTIVKGESDENKFKVKSPIIKSQNASWVMVAGQFQSPKGAGGGSGGSKVVDYIDWRSELVAPGIHVILLNRYPDPINASDQYQVVHAPGGKKIPISRNRMREYCAKAIYDVLVDSTGKNVLCYACGLDRTGSQFKLLPAPGKDQEDRRIESLDDKLAKDTTQGSVVTFNTLGEGQPRQINYATEDPQNEYKAVGVQKPLCDYELENEYAKTWLRPYLKNDAFVNLHHCYSADNTKHVSKKSAVDYVYNGLKDSKPQVVVTGHTGTANFEVFWNANTSQPAGYLPKPIHQIAGTVSDWGFQTKEGAK